MSIRNCSHVHTAFDGDKTKKFHQIAFVNNENVNGRAASPETDFAAREKLREKEREQAELIEREILNKRADIKKKKQGVEFPTLTKFSSSKAPVSVKSAAAASSPSHSKPPETYFDGKKPKKPSVKTSKAPSAPPPSQKLPQEQPPTSPSQQQPSKTSPNKQKDRDRSVDVYNETVRQRATTRTVPPSTKDVFPAKKDGGSSDGMTEATKKKVRRNIHSKTSRVTSVVTDIDDDELPSVRKLRSRFEDRREVVTSASTPQLNVVTTASSPKRNKFAFKAKGVNPFNVMSSLTRRSAMSVSKSLYNININYEDANEKGKYCFRTYYI